MKAGQCPYECFEEEAAGHCCVGNTRGGCSLEEVGRKTEFFEGQDIITEIEGKWGLGDAKGVVHISPGQRPGFILPKPH